MTTYPLSEPATIYRSDAHQSDAVVSRGSLSDCADLLQDWSTEDRAAVRIEIDDMELRYGPEQIEELLKFLREEDDAPLPAVATGNLL
ncbi:hypothetical protein ACFOKI_01815 [Sphingomonas qilianensis]|uniref:Uncharacterized protein n=1 Tax=Sphingomonas qilianensis TaxID=1736690 RepID=A0ABU9XS84_9SPHN